VGHEAGAGNADADWFAPLRERFEGGVDDDHYALDPA
jgi:hypothetical protein